MSRMNYHVNIDSEENELAILEREGRRFVLLDGEELPVDFQQVDGNDSFSLLIGDASYPVTFETRPDGLSVTVESESYLLTVEDERTRAARSVRKGGAGKDKAKVILSMMPGIVREVRVQPGDEVAAGQALLILEAMKMENEIRSALDGTVKQVHVEPEATVNKGDPLITLL